MTHGQRFEVPQIRRQMPRQPAGTANDGIFRGRNNQLHNGVRHPSHPAMKTDLYARLRLAASGF
jgi:hypothetical protein